MAINFNLLKRFLLTLALLFIILTTDVLFGQDFEFSLVPRRSYDQLRLEVWGKSLSVTTPKLGNASLVIQYNTAYLFPSPTQNLTKTDSLLMVEQNSSYPVIDIESNFNSANGYATLTSGSYSTGYYSLEINHELLGIGGLQLETTGRGSFLGILTFNIIGNPADTSLANFQWSKSSFPGDIAVFDINGNDIEPQITFIDPSQDFGILGVTLLSPIWDNQVIDRDATYKFLEKDLVDGGYPIYFERSVNPLIYTPIDAKNRNIDEDLGYLLEYSLDAGTNWNEIGRFVETDKATNSAKGTTYISGEIFVPKSYYVTTQKGQQLNATTFKEPLRVIWSKNPNFIYRSEQAKIRITILNEDITIPVTNRTPSNVNSITAGNLVLGRLFFVQLDGVTKYLKTNTLYSNPTQLTVMAWINLNSYQQAGNNPAIVATSGGPNSAPILGSSEGAWKLYLRDGRVPAFSVREVEGRGVDGSIYLADISAYSQDSLTVVSAESPLTEAHSENWVHLAATVQDNTVVLYVNGEVVNSAINTNANNIRMLPTEHPIWIGVNPNVGFSEGSFLNAGIKNVQIWRTALSQEQIRSFASVVLKPDSITTYNDIKKGLEMYWTLEGTTADLASNIEYQYGREDISAYDDALASQITPQIFNANNNIITNISHHKYLNTFQATNEVLPTYRPDRPHLQLTSPGAGAGVLNKAGDNTEIRWVTYGMSDIDKAVNLNFEIEYSIDNGETWHYAKKPSGANLTGNNIDNTQSGYAIWQPYQNNNPDANLRSIDPYSKTAMLRLTGLDSDGNIEFISYSDTFTIAPFFALETQVGTQLMVDRNIGMNITGNYAYIEAWIRPYRFPTDAEAFFPIVEKSDGDIHYGFRLYNDGTLGFVVTNTEGTLLTARTSSDFTIVRPNSVDKDSAWTHVSILFIKNNDEGISEARFYIDGKMQAGNALGQQFTTQVQLRINNDYPLYVGANPNAVANSFVGDLKEIRFWNDIPNNLDIYGDEPTEFTKFVQQSQSEVIKDITNQYKKNLHSYFTMDGGTFFANGGSRVVAVSDINGALLNNYGTPVRYVPFKPFIKLVEPVYDQRVTNNDNDVRVRWVGLYYNGLDFTAGQTKITPSLEFSIRGGGGNEVQPYQYVGSFYWPGNKNNSIKLINTNEYQSLITSNNKYYALSLNAALANPDVNGDGNYNDQGPLSPTLTNARLRLTGSYTISGESFPLQTEGPLFTINPLSNFTVRVMLEGYHQGNVGGKIVNQLGSKYEQGGLKIHLYTDISGEAGEKVGNDAYSTTGYSERDPVNLNKGNTRFGNVDFVFTDIANGSYWLVVEHINHLPIMSRYPVPFTFVGDVQNTWSIESGWDFMSWNGVDYNIMPSPTTDIWSGRYYTARGNAVNTPINDPDGYATTGLIYNGGNSENQGLPSMVGGDVNQDKQINAADRVKVRQEVGLLSYESDITGDKYVNAVDRTITDKNFGKTSSLFNITLPPSVAVNSFNAIDFSDFDLSTYFNKMAAKVYYMPNENPQDINIIANNKIQKKNKNTLQAISYYVSATTIYNDSGFVDVNMYIRNDADEFALANCTFAILFDTTNLTFNSLRGADSVIFNSEYDYSNLNFIVPENGYLKLSSAPNSNSPKAYKGIRSIEVDYDAFANIGGINVPHTKTYLGTLRFNVAKNTGVVALRWHESKAVITTKGNNITDNGHWDSIPAVLLYKAKIVQPNGGENYSIVSGQKIKWTATNKAKINIEFSSNGGYNWIRLNDTAIYSDLLEYDWITPNITSNNCLIRIIDAETNTELDKSDDVFSINPPWGYINKPFANPEPYIAGTNTNIEWTAGGTTCVKFEFSSDGGATWTKINGTFNPALGKTKWLIPRITTKNAYIRMLDCESDLVLSTSGKFMILNGSIRFTAPTKATKWKGTTIQKVRWVRQNVEYFDLEVSLNNGETWTLVEENVDAKKLYYDWNVPEVNTDFAIFRAIYNNDANMLYGKSDLFKIYYTPTNIVEELWTNVSNVFPNPTNNEASIKFTLNEPMSVSIDLLDITGNKITTLTENMQLGSGEQIWTFNIKNITNGKYYLFIKSDKLHTIREIIITN